MGVSSPLRTSHIQEKLSVPRPTTQETEWAVKIFTVEALDKQHNTLRTLLKLPKEFVIHSLRHTFGTLLGNCGVDSFLIKKIMGHSTATVSGRYVRPSEKAVERAFEQVQKRR